MRRVGMEGGGNSTVVQYVHSNNICSQLTKNTPQGRVRELRTYCTPTYVTSGPHSKLRTVAEMNRLPHLKKGLDKSHNGVCLACPRWALQQYHPRHGVGFTGTRHSRLNDVPL